MMNKRPSNPTMRIVLGTLAAVALLTAATAAASSTPITSDQFVPGWQDHARGLFNSGPARRSSMTSWMVPGTLPSGLYVLAAKNGDKTEIINGYQFQVSGDAARKIFMILPAGYRDVLAIPASDVPTLKVRRDSFSYP